MYIEHMRDPISDALAVACRINAQRNVYIGRRVRMMKVNVLILYKLHVVIRADNRSRLPQPIENREVNLRQEWVVIVTLRIEAQGVF